LHLRAIKLRGFKSFPDPVEVRLEPGVAVVVGPNGSGKSNVADGIVWAAGSLTPSELRAEKADDVLFAGGGGRGQSDYCEVELLFDNTAGDGPLDYAELAVTRRLHRGGEGQYLVNRAPVRRIDLIEILSDLGLAGGMHSIIGQGKVEAILGSKPEERRAMVEEAAGLGRFKRRRHRAELKLARVAVQVERARDLEAEVRGRLRPLALQATAAERAEKLAGEISGLRVRIALLELEAIEERLEDGTGRAVDAALVRRAAEEKLEALLVERGQAEQELADAAGGRESASAALYRLRTAGERVAMRRESVGGLAETLRARSAPPEPVDGPSPAELERAAREAAEAARAAAAEHDNLAERSRLAVERLAALERSLAEREGIPPAARAFAEEGARLALGELEVEPGLERAVAAALGRRASALLATDSAAALALIERARAAGLGSLVVVTSPGEPLAGFTLVETDELLDATGPAVTRDGIGYDPERGELWFAGETAEAVQLELAARRDALVAETEELAARAAGAQAAVAETATLARAAAAALEALGPARRARRADPATVARILALAERLDAVLAAASAVAARFEAPLQVRVDAGATRTGELGSELRRLGAAEVELRHASSEAAQAAAAIDVELARLGAEADEVRRRIESEPNAHEHKDSDESVDREELAVKLERLERRHEALGRVNPLAKEEYEAEKARVEELSVQREDLEASLKELEELRADLTRTVETRFAETFASVQAHFEEVASTLFPGGEGRLRTTEPAEGDDEEAAEPGIEIELRPAGKKVTRLSLLSGGEKSLGAISFLFALFLARPCPFYLLDEVEAALDDTNIGRFVELLRRYSDRAQFIVITHQKRTMEAADILYGVTMGADGISQVVSRRLPREEAEAVSAA